MKTEINLKSPTNIIFYLILKKTIVAFMIFVFFYNN